MLYLLYKFDFRFHLILFFYLQNTHMKNLTTFVMAIFLAMSCQNESIDPITLNANEPHFKDGFEEASSRVAETLNLMLSDKNFRKVLKEETLKQFDGDYNVLFTQFITKKFQSDKHGYISVGEYFRTFQNRDENSHLLSGITNNPKDLLDSIAIYHPLLQIAIPEIPNLDASLWDTEQTLLPIAISLIDEKEEEIPLLTLEGTWTSITRLEYPENLVIVISQNERVTTKPKNNKLSQVLIDDSSCSGDPFFSDESNTYYLTSTYYEAQNNCNFGGGGSGSGGSSSGSNNNEPSCIRDNNPSYDRIKGIKFNNINRLRDTWDKGQVELHLKVFFGSDGDGEPLLKTFGGDKGDWRSCGFLWTNCKTKWYNTDTELIIWNKNEYGKKLFFRWYENDGDSNVREEKTCYEWTDENGVKIENCVTETIHEEDDQLGKSFPIYCDDISGDGFTYDTGDLRFILAR